MKEKCLKENAKHENEQVQKWFNKQVNLTHANGQKDDKQISQRKVTIKEQRK
jgi:hypothetical protein